MAEAWPVISIESIAAQTPNALATGPFGSAISSRFFVNTGVPVLRGSNLSEATGVRLVEDDFVFLAAEKAEAFERSVARRGDLVLTCWGTIGQVGLVDGRSKYDRYIVSNKQMKLTPDASRVDSLFLYYAFSGPEFQYAMRSQAIGSSVPGFNLGQLRNMRLALPTLKEQRAIALILGSLDDKIELNRRMNETLEAIARALFKSWFVDFDPVRAKMRGEQPAGMDASRAALFPSKLVQTDHGEVPEGWELRPLDSVATFLNGLALQKFPAGDGPSLPVIKIAEMRAGATAKSDRAAMTIPPQYIVDDGDLLFSWSGSLDIIVWTGGRGALNQHLFKVSSPTYPPWFLLAAVRQHLPNFQAIAASKATTMGHIQRHHLSEALVAVPPAHVIADMGRTLTPIHERFLVNSQEARTLATLRDTLLPRLLSGELRVSDAERSAEAA